MDHILPAGASEIAAKNPCFLKSIIQCIEHCGRQGIALKGHRDDENPPEADETKNMGNFGALVKLVSRTNEELMEYLESCMKTASYTPKTTQNDPLIDCIQEYIQEKIVEEVKAQPLGPFFAVIADEVIDSSNWEQLGVIVRHLKDESLLSA
ncbi:52 kDa repressor of the inhibitor of the protein kinase-like [Diadema setosum]|uniref:52 kDa repressor of the inhibitor of the protein kinase-like n=1 Tax=Diadema setosum TaxID=31175 RepID=UPI003B3B64D2